MNAQKQQAVVNWDGVTQAYARLWVTEMARNVAKARQCDLGIMPDLLTEMYQDAFGMRFWDYDSRVIEGDIVVPRMTPNTATELALAFVATGIFFGLEPMKAARTVGGSMFNRAETSGRPAGRVWAIFKRLQETYPKAEWIEFIEKAAVVMREILPREADLLGQAQPDPVIEQIRAAQPQRRPQPSDGRRPSDNRKAPQAKARSKSGKPAAQPKAAVSPEEQQLRDIKNCPIPLLIKAARATGLPEDWDKDRLALAQVLYNHGWRGSDVMSLKDRERDGTPVENPRDPADAWQEVQARKATATQPAAEPAKKATKPKGNGKKEASEAPTAAVAA